MSSSAFKLSLLVAACVMLFAASHVDAECSGPEAYGDFYAVEQKAEGLTPKLENGAREIFFFFAPPPLTPSPLPNVAERHHARVRCLKRTALPFAAFVPF